MKPIGSVPQETLQEAALAYAARGWYVLPLHSVRDGRCTCGGRCASPGKHPLVDGGFKAATADPDTIRGWWSRWPWANVGIATGPSGLAVLDVDGTTGRNSLRGKALPVTPVVESGRLEGGLHYYFRRAGDVPSCNPLPGLTLRAATGYVVAAGSLHASGRRYRWAPGFSPDDVPLAPLPAWLLEAAKPTKARYTPEDWVAIIREGAEPGGRHPALVKLAGHLLGKRVDPRVALELLLAWNAARCRPPKPVEEVVDIVRCLWRKDMRKERSA